MKLKILIAIIAVAIFTASAYAEKKKHPEKWYQEKWCAAKGGESEVVLPDKTRVDCLTGDYAVNWTSRGSTPRLWGKLFIMRSIPGKGRGLS